ncbi:hypothetical protein ACPCTK_08860 [Streptomyces pseudogriseolus]|uniref:hypothetical protein n=1 Tax=Streptomyces pseudogriseolus TaxID=36817 RepID=UPI003FA2B7B6
MTATTDVTTATGLADRVHGGWLGRIAGNMLGKPVRCCGGLPPEAATPLDLPGRHIHYKTYLLHRHILFEHVRRSFYSRADRG